MTNTQEDGITNAPNDRPIAKKHREMFGATQSDVAEDAKISQGKLSLWENGLVNLTENELQRLNKVLNALEDCQPGFTSAVAGTFAQEYASWTKRKQVKARRSARRQAHLTLIALAKKMDIPEKKLREWEKGKDRVELTNAEEEKWMREITASRVEKIKADPWMRPAFMADTILKERAELLKERRNFLSRLQNLSRIDDPIIAEIIGSFRREIADLEQQAKKPVGSNSEAD